MQDTTERQEHLSLLFQQRHLKILGCSGKVVDLMNLRPEDVNIEDIAWSLSQQCRFNGHTKFFYSVAEHSVLVAKRVETESPVIRLQALLHDAAEAYLGDIIQPVKVLFPAIGILEEHIQKVIFAKYGVPLKMDPRVIEADQALLQDEIQELILNRTGHHGLFNHELNRSNTAGFLEAFRYLTSACHRHS